MTGHNVLVGLFIVANIYFLIHYAYLHMKMKHARAKWIQNRSQDVDSIFYVPPVVDTPDSPTNSGD